MTNSTASTSAKDGKKAASHGGTPFDDLVSLEQQEAQRVQKELDALQREREEIEAAIDEKEKKAEEELRKTAKEELRRMREEDVTTMMMKAKAEAEQTSSSLQQSATTKAPQVIDTLVKHVTDNPERFLT